MKFEIIDLETITEEELLKVLSNNSKTARLMNTELDKLRKAAKTTPKKEQQPEEEYFDFEEETESRPKIDQDFEDEVDYYYQLLCSYDKDNLEKEIHSILPSRQNYNYEKIIYRMIAEVLKNLKEIKDFFGTEKVSQEEAEAFREDIELEETKLRLLRHSLEPQSEEEEDLSHENKLIFFPTPSGNIHVLDALEGIDSEFYERFEELFNSIKSGTFKGVKRFNNHNTLNGLCEVRGNQVRVVYDRISSDEYVIISAFTKKTDRDQSYANYLVKHCRDYNNIKQRVKEELDDPEFQELNRTYEEELFRILSTTQDTKSHLTKNKRGDK